MIFRNADPRLLTILLIIFVQLAGAAMALPLLPLYAQREFEIAPQMITLLVSTFFMAQFLSGPVIGRLSDRHGRLPVLIISQIGTVISFSMLFLAQSVEVLFLARVLDGITGGNIVVVQAYVTDVTPREQRTQSLGYVFAALGLGFIIGPALGGLLAAFVGVRLPFFMAAVAALVTLLLTWFTLDESLTPEQREKNRQKGSVSLAPRQVVTNIPLLLILLLAFGAQFTLGLVQGTFALYGEAVLFVDYSEEMTNLGIGLLLAVAGFGMFFSQMFLLRAMLRRFREAVLVLIGALLRILSLAVLALILSPWLGPIPMLLFAIGSGLTLPSLQSLATETVADEIRGGVLGVFQSAISLSIICGTALSGVLFALGPTVPYWLGSGLAVMLLLPALVLLRWSRRVAARPTVTAPANSG
jgi:MFS transporter, DHA1 family, tetracycline resistance protein